MKLRRILPLFLLFLVAILVFASCGKKEPEETEPKLEPIELSNFSSYKIVYPEEPGPELLLAARALYEDIKTKTGVTLPMSDDFVMPDWTNGGAQVGSPLVAFSVIPRVTSSPRFIR